MADDRLSTLPIELKAEILSKLTLKSLIQIKSLSKTWQSEINSPYFIKLYIHSQSLNNNNNNLEFNNDSSSSILLIGNSSFYIYTFENDEVFRELYHHPPNFGSSITKIHVIGSCNRLVCFQESACKFSLFNPVTGTYKLLPHILPSKLKLLDSSNWSNSNHIIIKTNAGFGYDCTSHDYKILALVMIIAPNDGFDDDPCYYENYIYSLKMNSWRKLENKNNYLSIGEGVIWFKNALHWVTNDDHNYYQGNYNNNSSNNQSAIILGFNLGIEEYYELGLPNGGVYSACDVNLVALNGCLHMIEYSFWDMIMNIWVMKKYGVTNLWTKLVQLLIKDQNPWACRPLPYVYSENRRKILLGLEQHPENFLVCDVQSREVINKFNFRDLANDYGVDGFAVVPFTWNVVCDDPLMPKVEKILRKMKNSLFVVIIVLFVVLGYFNYKITLAARLVVGNR